MLERHRLALVAEIQNSGFDLLGFHEGVERAAWAAIEKAGQIDGAALSRTLDIDPGVAEVALERLAALRVVLPVPGSPATVRALSTLLIDA